MLLNNLFDESKEALEHFFQNVDKSQIEKVLQVCLKTKGILVLTGVGKSGIIAEKIARTLVSTGTRALFVPPGNFLHGDLGVVDTQDVVILISKSGESEELLDIIPFIKKRKATLIAVTSRKNSRLEKEAMLCVHLPVSKELGPLDLVPTISTTVQLLFGDILTIALMQEKKLLVEEYASNHPEGAIGKRLHLKVEDLMLKDSDLPLSSGHQKVIDVLFELSAKKCGCLVVVDEEKKLKGIFTDGDLRRCLQRFGAAVLEQPLHALMTQDPLTISKEILAWDAKKMMQNDPKRWIMMLPVIEEDKVVGLIKMHDIIHAGI